MSYLFGDSTPSKLEVNFIDFLRDAVHFSVQVLLVEQRIAQGHAHTRSLEQLTAEELERLQKLPPLVATALDGMTTARPDSATARCAVAISSSAFDLVLAEAGTLRSTLENAIKERDAQAKVEGERSVRALEKLLLQHDLPDTVEDIRITLANGERYAARSHLMTEAGLDVVLELEIPAEHLFEKLVRVDRLTERLEVHAPELGGWLHKEVKQRAQRLEKHYVSELTVGPSGGKLGLRASPDGTGPGFDFVFSQSAPRVRLLRVDQKQEPSLNVEEGDAKQLSAFFDKLTLAARTLRAHRKKLLEARFDGEPLRDYEKPSVLVSRLVAAVAPVVQEIASRSQSPNELVLRRILGQDRREEIFLSKTELKRALEPLAENHRTLFDPLWAPTPPPLKREVPPLPVEPLPAETVTEIEVPAPTL